MTIKGELDVLIDDLRERIGGRIVIFIGRETKAALREELRPLLTHPTESGRPESYRGCEIGTLIDGDGMFAIAYGESPS